MAGKGHPLAKSALGTKRVCTGCAAKFYDLGKDPIVCPTCDTVYVIPKAPPRPASRMTKRKTPKGTPRTRRSQGSRTSRRTEPKRPVAFRCWKSSTRNNERVEPGAVPGVRRLLRLFG